MKQRHAKRDKRLINVELACFCVMLFEKEKRAKSRCFVVNMNFYYNKRSGMYNNSIETIGR